MNYKPFFLVVMFALFIGVNGTSAQDECTALDNVSTALTTLQTATADCQLETGWQVPPSFANHIAKAMEYCESRPNGKTMKKVYNSLQGLDEAITEAINGEPSYLLDGILDLWSDPVPPAPECAIDALGVFQDAVQAAMLLFE